MKFFYLCKLVSKEITLTVTRFYIPNILAVHFARPWFL